MICAARSLIFDTQAVNKEGESEPLVTETTIVAKNPFDEPGKPGNLKATDWDKDHVDLKWTPPAGIYKICTLLIENFGYSSKDD